MPGDLARVIVCGSRAWDCPYLSMIVVGRIMLRFGLDVVIVHGACQTGVDWWIDRAARDLDLCVEPHRADWRRWGRAAGPIRNQEMVERGAVLCLGLSPDLSQSRGTADCMGRAAAAAIPTFLIDGIRRPRRIVAGVASCPA